MTFAEIVNAVIDATARPDKVVAIKRAVNNKLSQVSAIGDFNRDLEEVEPNVSALGTAFTISLDTMPRFRKIKYIKPTNRNVYIEAVDPTKVFIKNSCGVVTELRDCYYLAGNNLRISLANAATTIAIGYFAYPAQLVQDTDTHWILTASPDVIIAGAAANIFAEIGDDASANSQEGLYRSYLEVLLRDARGSW